MRRSPNWHLVTGVTMAMILGSAAMGFTQFTSSNDRTRSILEGNWQSCRESDGVYAERVRRQAQLRPVRAAPGHRMRFALFRGVQDDHRAHESPDNLLRPHIVELLDMSAKQKWDVAGLHLEVTLAGGSREECESWWLVLRRTDSTSSH